MISLNIGRLTWQDQMQILLREIIEEKEKKPMGYWLYAEDLARALIGPFESKESAQEHIEFCRRRGDADPGKIVTEEEAEKLRSDLDYTISADRDRNFKLDA